MSVVHAPTIPAPRLQNVVATFDMGTTKLNLHNLVLTCPFVQYTPKRFAAGVIRLKEPRTTCLVFASGKAVCTGATTEQLAQMAALKFVMLLQKQGVDVHFCNFKVQNIVSAAHCNFRVDLCKLADTVNGFCSYEPALFPGLMYRVQTASNPNQESNLVVFIVFQSGKCVITGGKNREQVVACWAKFFSDILMQYKTEMDFGGSGNYRMCQVSQRREKSDESIRMIANLCKQDEEEMENPQMLESVKWQGHLWDTRSLEESSLQKLLEPCLHRTQQSPERQVAVNSNRKTELRMLNTVAHEGIQTVLDLACAHSPEFETILKEKALYAHPLRGAKGQRV